MHEIIFLDKDPHYTSTVCGLLSSAFNKISFFSFNTLKELEKHETKKKSSFRLLFFNMEEFDSPVFSGMLICLQSFKSKSSNSIYKFSPLSEFVRVITESMENHKEESAEYMETENICCVIGDCSILYRNKIISDIILQKLKDGFIPVIAQICPKHQEYNKENNNIIQRNLSDFMMRIISENTKDLAPGLYVEPMSDASLCFRPFQYTDDLYDCSADNIREFVQILRQWINIKADPIYLIIILWSVPFSFIYSACVQSDKIIILNGSDNFNSQEFNREISSLLSNLRTTVKVNGFYEFSKGEEYVLP